MSFYIRNTLCCIDSEQPELITGPISFYIRNTICDCNDVDGGVPVDGGDAVDRSFSGEFIEYAISTNHSSIMAAVFQQGTPAAGDALQVDYIFTSSGGSTDIKMWNIPTSALESTFTGHSAGITSLVVSDNHLFSGSLDGSVIIWSINTRQEVVYIQPLPGPDILSVDSLFVSDNTLYVAYYNDVNATGTIKSYDLNGTPLVDFNTGFSKNLFVEGNSLFFTTRIAGITAIKKIDIQTQQAVATFSLGSDIINFPGTESNIIVKKIIVHGNYIYVSSLGLVQFPTNFQGIRRQLYSLFRIDINTGNISWQHDEEGVSRGLDLSISGNYLYSTFGDPFGDAGVQVGSCKIWDISNDTIDPEFFGSIDLPIHDGNENFNHILPVDDNVFIGYIEKTDGTNILAVGLWKVFE